MSIVEEVQPSLEELRDSLVTIQEAEGLTDLLTTIRFLIMSYYRHVPE